MKHINKLKGIYPITPQLNNNEITYLDNINKVISSGIKIIQFREKSISQTKKKKLVNEIYKTCIANNVQLIINDDHELLKYYEGAGLHLGDGDLNIIEARKKYGENIIIGVSCYNSLENAFISQESGADYVSFGAVFPTKSKNNAKKCSLQIMKNAKVKLKIPICLIGGIMRNNILDVIKYEPDMIGIISGIFNTNDAKLETLKIIKKIEEYEEFKEII